MPKIPTYERRETIPGVAKRVPQSISGAGAVGRAVQDFGSAINYLADRQMELREEERHYSSLRIGNLVNDDALGFEQTSLELREIESYNSMDRVEDWVKQATEKYTQGVEDEKVRQSVTQHIQAKSLTLKNSLATHEATQRDVVANNTRGQSLENASKSAYLGHETLDNNLQAYNKVILSDPRLGAEEKETALMAGQSAIAEKRLEGMIYRSPQAAKELIKAGLFNEWLTSDTLQRFGEKIKQQLMDESTLQGVGLATQVFKGNPGSTVSELRDMLKKQTSDKDILSAAFSELNALDANLDEEKLERAQEASDVVERTITNARETKPVVTLADIPEDEWTILKKDNPTKASALLKEFRQDAQQYKDKIARDKKETIAEADRRTLENYISLTVNTDLLMRSNLTKMWKMGDLSDSQYKSLATKKRDALANPDKLDQLVTEGALVKSIANRSGLKDGSEDYTLFIHRVEQDRKSYREQHGKAMSTEDLEKAARKQLYKIDPPGLFKFSRPAYELTIEDIPEEEKALIVERFGGRAHTDEQIIDIYVRAIMEAKR